MIYIRTNCGLRTVVKILEIFNEVLEGKCGKVPCYNTVENWMKKLGLSTYENDNKPTDKKFAYIIDESIMVNREKLLLILGVSAEHPGHPLKHEDVTVVSMKSCGCFKGDDIKQEIEKSIEKNGAKPEYVISDQAHNLTNGISQSGLLHHIDISHAMGTCLKHAYGNEPDFVNFTTILGKVRLQYHLTDKAYLLPPNMRSIARFMNMNSWVDWGNKMLGCFASLPKEMQDAYSFVLDYKELLVELKTAVAAVEHIETICKTEGFNLANSKKCKNYITRHIIGNANNRRAMFGIKILEYLKQQEEKLNDIYESRNISSDIIESTFGVFKQKKSPNKLYGITPFVLFIPLHAKLENKSATKTFNFKERLCNVKLKDIDTFANNHMSTNWVTVRTKQLKNVG
ncbi:MULTISPECIES: hypothetical protein [Bacteroides]|nr:MULTISPECIES: hypothetical protein [Bacteroides]